RGYSERQKEKWLLLERNRLASPQQVRPFLSRRTRENDQDGVILLDPLYFLLYLVWRLHLVDVLHRQCVQLRIRNRPLIRPLEFRQKNDVSLSRDSPDGGSGSGKNGSFSEEINVGTSRVVITGIHAARDHTDQDRRMTDQRRLAASGKVRFD